MVIRAIALVSALAAAISIVGPHNRNLRWRARDRGVT